MPVSQLESRVSSVACTRLNRCAGVKSLNSSLYIRRSSSRRMSSWPSSQTFAKFGPNVLNESANCCSFSKNARPHFNLTDARRSSLAGSSSVSICLSGVSTFLPRIASTISRSVRARMFSSPSSGSTADMYSEKALPGERICMRFASSVSRCRYIKNAARCMAIEVFPEPAPPTTEMTFAAS